MMIAENKVEDAAGDVLFDVRIHCGEGKHNKRWTKRVVGLTTPFVPDTRGIVGEFVRSSDLPSHFEGVGREGEYLLLGASHVEYYPYYVLVRLKAGSEFRIECHPYTFFGRGVEVVTDDTVECDKKAFAADYPAMRSAIGRPMLPIFDALARGR